MNEFLLGTSVLSTAEASLLKDAGIGWLRQGFPYPWAERPGGETTDEYQKAKARAKAWATKGFQLMGITPLVGIGTQKPDAQGRLHLTWRDRFPAWMGHLGSSEFCQNYQKVCAFLAEDLRGIVEMWQIANELDIRQFAGPLNLRQACDLVLCGARGLKQVSEDLIVGTNTAGSDRAYYFYGRLHADPDGPLDYCGVDAYYGTWQRGGPEDWADRIAELYDITGRKVLVNEWGFSSAGGLMSTEERQYGLPVCELKKWYHSWGEGHTPKGQAEYVRTAFEAFKAKREKLLGLFFYRWEDQEQCWQCGAPDCPAETAWGLVDREGKPKPAFFAFKEGVQRLLA